MRNKHQGIIFYSVIAVLGFFIALIGFNKILIHQNKVRSENYKVTLIEKSPAHTKYRNTFSVDGEAIFDYISKFKTYPGGLELRDFEGLGSLTEASKQDTQIVLLGGSYVSGFGLEDSNTLPYLLNKKLSDESSERNYRVLSLSKAGWSLAHILELLNDNSELFDHLSSEKDTYFFYFLPFFHFERFSLSYKNYLSAAEFYDDFPLFEVHANNVIYRGKYSDHFQRQKYFLNQVSNLGLVSKELFMRIESRLPEARELLFFDSSKTWDDFFLLIEHFNEALVKKNNRFKFYVIPYPTIEPPSLKKEYNFNVLKLKTPENFDVGRAFIKYDHHPSGYMNQVLAEELAQFIKMLP